MLRIYIRYKLLVSIIFIWCLIFCSVCNAELSKDAILQILTSRDAQLDNVNLHYNESYEIPIPGDALAKIPLDERREILKRGALIKHQYNRQMAIRDNEVTFNSKLDESVKKENPHGFGFIPFTRRSNVAGANREYLKQYDGYEELSIRPAGPSRDILLQDRMHVEFSLGFGFGKRIKEISSVTKTSTGYMIKGLIQPYQIEPCPFEMEIDQDFVVRHATITTTAGKGTTEFIINTEGVIKDGEFVFPMKGSFKKTLSEYENGQLVGKPMALRDFDVQFEKVDWNLTNNEYGKLTRFNIAPGTRIYDYIKGVRYTTGKFPDEVYDVRLCGPTPSPFVLSKGKSALPFPQDAIWLNSKPLNWEHIKGKIVILDFWAYWCGGCLKELQIINQEYKKIQEAGIVVIGIHTAEGEIEEIKKTIKKYGLHYPICIDTREIPSKGFGAMSNKYGVSQIPYAFIVNDKGYVAGHGQTISNILDKACEIVEKRQTPKN